MFILNLEADEFASLSSVVQVKKKDKRITINLPYLKTTKQGDFREYKRKTNEMSFFCNVHSPIFMILERQAEMFSVISLSGRFYCHVDILEAFVVSNNPKEFKSP